MTNTIQIYFDGGYSYQSGQCYGSWEVIGDGKVKKESRINFTDCDQPSCNSAEYLSLLAALNYLRQFPDKDKFLVQIFTDSTLVEKQVKGEWKNKKPHLKKLCAMVRNNLACYGSYEISWRSRVDNVARFGH